MTMADENNATNQDQNTAAKADGADFSKNVEERGVVSRDTTSEKSDQDDKSKKEPEADKSKDGKSEDDKSKDPKADGEKEDDVVPDKYEDFTIPEGMEIDTERLEEFQSFAKAHGLTQKAAQAAVDLHLAGIEKFASYQQDQWDKIKAEWAEKTKADKELHDENVS
jgi:hypothetical protein